MYSCSRKPCRSTACSLARSNQMSCPKNLVHDLLSSWKGEERICLSQNNIPRLLAERSPTRKLIITPGYRKIMNKKTLNKQ